jgi:putative aldouronate transport system substrate-binding protein
MKFYDAMAKKWGAANPDKGDPTKVIGIVPPLKKDAKSKPAFPMYIDYGALVFSKSVNDNKMARIMELMDYLKRPDIVTMLNYGFEGKEYEMINSKPILQTDPATSKLFDIAKLYPSSRISPLTDWGADLDLEGSTVPDKYLNMALSAIKLHNSAVVASNPIPAIVSSPAKDALSPQYEDRFVQIIMGTDDVAKMFNDYVQEMKDKGATKAIEEVNAFIKK